MKKIFVSHSSANNAEAEFLKNWLHDEGWSDLFLDFDEKLGIKAGTRWQQELGTAMRQCDAMLILLSPAWVGSSHCLAELNTASMQHKPILGCIVESLPYANVPVILTAEWQMVDLTRGERDVVVPIVFSDGQPGREVAFSSAQLRRLKTGLQAIGLDATYFPWPPKAEPHRSPYPGLAPLSENDTGIYFGRDGKIGDALKQLRRIRADGVSTMMVILGASGAGKSSFMRAGLLPRLQRDDRHFLVLPAVRPLTRPISGPSGGLVRSIVTAFRDADMRRSLDEIEAAVAAGSASVRALLLELCRARPPEVFSGDALPLPSVILPIDQGEEMIFTDPNGEAALFFSLFQDLLAAPPSAGADELQLIVLLTIRTDQYERFQLLPQKSEMRRENFSLPPMPIGEYGEVVRGPARRFTEARDAGAERGLDIEERLIDALLVDIQAGGARDSLPLLAFTLQRLFDRYGDGGRLTLEGYDKLGRIRGSIAAAIDRVMDRADGQPDRIPTDRAQRMLLIRRGLIPWLAGIDPETQQPRRRVARLSEIPQEARPLIDLMTEERLLSSDRDPDTGEVTIEPAHEALLRQWSDLGEWLRTQQADFSAIDGIRRATTEWAANAKSGNWLSHRGSRLDEAEQSAAKEDFRKLLEPTDLDYLAACRVQETAERDREIAALKDRQRIMKGRLTAAVAATGIFIVASVCSALLFWRAEDQRNRASAALDVARSQQALTLRDVEGAARLGMDAFRKLQNVETRSAFLSAAMEISPHLNLVHRVDGMTPIALAWDDHGRLSVATREGRLLNLAIDDVASTERAFAAAKISADGMDAHVAGIYPAFGGMAGLLFDGRLVFATPGDDSRSAPIRDEIAVSLKPRGRVLDTDVQGRTLAAVTADGDALVYRCSSATPAGLPFCRRQTVRRGDIQSVAVSPDGALILAGAGAGELIDLGSRGIVSKLPRPADALGFSHDGRYLAAASSSGEIFVADRSATATGPFAPVGSDGASVPGIAWSPTRDELAYICNPNAICLRSASQPADTSPLRFTGHTRPVLQIAWSPDGGYLASIATDNSLRIWQRTPDERVRRQIPVSTSSLESLAVDRSSGRIATGDEAGAVWIIDGQGAPRRWPVVGAPSRAVSSLDWSGGGRLAALFKTFGYASGLATDADVAYRRVADAGELQDLAWLGEDSLALLPVASSLVQVVGAATGEVQSALPEVGEITTPFVARADREGRHLFVAYADGSVRDWDMTTRTATMLHGPATRTGGAARRGSARSMSVTEPQKKIAFDQQNGNVILSDIASGETYRLNTLREEPAFVSFSPSGDRIAALTSSGMLQVWQTGTGREPMLAVGAMPESRPTGAMAAGQPRRATRMDWRDDGHILIATSAGELHAIALDEDGWAERLRFMLRYSR